MVAVDVGVGHQHDLVVAQLVEVELLVDAGAERGDDRLDLGVGQHLVDAGLLDVEDLAADRQDRLDPRVAALLGRAAGRVALDDEDLALLGVGRLAVATACRAGRRRRAGPCGCGPGRGPCGRRSGRCAAACALRTMSLPSAGFCSNQSPSWSLTTCCTKPLASVLPSLVLVWPSNCGSAELDRDDRGQALADVVAGDAGPRCFLIRPHSSPQLLTSVGERGAEALLVGAALVGVDGVGEGVHRLGVARCSTASRPRGSCGCSRSRGLGLEGDDRRVGRVLAPVEVLDVVDEAAVVA